MYYLGMLLSFMAGMLSGHAVNEQSKPLALSAVVLGEIAITLMFMGR